MIGIMVSPEYEYSQGGARYLRSGRQHGAIGGTAFGPKKKGPRLPDLRGWGGMATTGEWFGL